MSSTDWQLGQAASHLSEYATELGKHFASQLDAALKDAVYGVMDRPWQELADLNGGTNAVPDSTVVEILTAAGNGQLMDSTVVMQALHDLVYMDEDDRSANVAALGPAARQVLAMELLDALYQPWFGEDDATKDEGDDGNGE